MIIFFLSIWEWVRQYVQRDTVRFSFAEIVYLFKRSFEASE